MVVCNSMLNTRLHLPFLLNFTVLRRSVKVGLGELKHGPSKVQLAPTLRPARGKIVKILA
jgi:hypothetical protein